MALNIISDAAINLLICETKIIPGGLCPLSLAKGQVERNQHRRKEYEIPCASGNCFVVALRQSMLNILDFSVILGYKMPGFNTVFRLRRYNGKSHYHSNTIEGQYFHGFHIHTATERYQRIGSKEDHFAEVTERYYNMESAIDCLLADCGFRSPIEDSPLFSGTML